MRDRVENEYFEWMYGLVCSRNGARQKSYRKLLTFLHNTEFIFSVPMDSNRAADGVDLRYRFAYDCGNTADVERYLDGPCSVLEMMVALAIRCEEHIMDDPDIGDRTGQWFWDMIKNLKLHTMSDSRFNKSLADQRVRTFLERTYEPDGEGGLFTVPNSRYDLRDVEIWYQMCWYLNSIL